MEGVPVKISENYKPKVRKVLVIPQAITARLNTKPGHYHESSLFSYDFEIEKKVLANLAEWKNFRQIIRNNQRERKEKREQQKFRDIEDKNKELLTAVTYPSTEDLSFESENEEDCEKNKNLTCTHINTAVVSQEEKFNSTCTMSTNFSTVSNSFHTILQPTVLSRDSSINTCTLTPLYDNKINYSDFENDTSSPFDNIELKTINDLDILAQVLHNSHVMSDKKEDASAQVSTLEDDNRSQSRNYQSTSNKNNTTNTINIPHQMIHQSCISPENRLNPFYMPNTIPGYQQETYMCNQIQHHNLTNNISFNYSNAYNGSADTMPQYLIGKQLPLNQCNQLSNNENGIFPIHSDCCVDENLITSFSALQRNAKPLKSDRQPGNECNTGRDPSLTTPIKCKSQSIPDILKQLDGKSIETNVSRHRNYNDVEHTANSGVTIEGNASPKSTYYSKLDASVQVIAQNISSMGYPLERVSKVAHELGRDDKKIVEHLILLDELIELGFEESKISAALLKFDNNKEKALDFLIL